MVRSRFMTILLTKTKPARLWLSLAGTLLALGAGVTPGWAHGAPGLLALDPAPAAAALVPAQEPDRYAITGDDVALYNLAGEVRLEAGAGPAVVVEVERGGKDAGQLRVETGRIEGRQTLRVIYPGDRVLYRGAGRLSSSQVRVRDDGTFGGERARSGRQVTVGGGGIGWTSGIEAHADLTIRIPAGQRLALHLAVGRVEVTNVAGDLVVDVGSAPITARGTRGYLRLDTGSGRVEVTDAVGAVEVDTGSGGVEVRRIRGPRLLVDTGSGGVRLALPPSVDARLEIDTGSGGITVDLPLRIVKKERSRLVGELGAGTGLIRIDTGSGGVRVTSSGVIAAR
jgi:DUF4097 and DUF4098 domain-containing protein YvlB